MKRELTDRILLLTIRIGLFGMLFVPLLYNPSYFFPFIVFKEVVFRTLVEIIFCAYIILVLRNPEYRPKINLLTILVFLFFVCATLSSMFGIDFLRSLWGNYERMGGIIRLWHLAAYFFVLISVIRNNDDWHSLFTFSTFVSVLMCFFGLAQRLNVSFFLESSGGNRLTGTIGNAIYLAAYVLFHVFFLSYFLIKDKKFNLKLFFYGVISIDIFLFIFDIIQRIGSVTSNQKDTILQQLFSGGVFLWAIVLFEILTFTAWFLRDKKYTTRIFLSFLLLLEVCVLLWTQTRGAIIGVFAAILFLAVTSVLITKNKKVKVGLGVGMALFLVAPFSLFIFKETSFVKNTPVLFRFADVSLTDITTQSRILTWRASFQGWTENPIRFLIGYGDENYSYVFDKHFPPEIFKDSGSQVWFDRAHNIFFDTAISYGLIGVILYFGMFGIALYFLYKKYKHDGDYASAAIFGALIIAYVVQNMLVFDTIDSYLLCYLILGYVAFTSDEMARRPAFLSRWIKPIVMHFHKKGGLGVFGTSTCIVVFLVIIFSFNIRLAQANRILYRAVLGSMQKPMETKKNIETFKASIYEAVTGTYEARQQFYAYAVNYANSASVSSTEKIAIAEQAIQEMLNSIKEEPRNARHYLFLANFYNRFGAFHISFADKALELLQPRSAPESVIALSPRRPQFYFEIAQAYLTKGDPINAMKALRKAVEVAPGSKDTHLALAFTGIQIKQYDLAEAELDYIYKNLQNNPSRGEFAQVAQLYENQGEYGRLVKLYEKILSLYPDEPQYLVQIARFEAALGHNQRAEDYIKKVLVVDPTQKKQVDEFLSQLKAGKLKK